MLKFDKLNIVINTKLSLIEKLPQVGSKKFDYEFDYDTKTFIFDREEIVDYIINNNSELLFGIGHYKLNKKKDTLISSGRLKIDKGRITYMDNDSGHYSPSYEHLVYICNIFRDNGLLDNNYKIVNIDNQL